MNLCKRRLEAKQDKRSCIGCDLEILEYGKSYTLCEMDEVDFSRIISYWKLIEYR